MTTAKINRQQYLTPMEFSQQTKIPFNTICDMASKGDIVSIKEIEGMTQLVYIPKTELKKFNKREGV